MCICCTYHTTSVNNFWELFLAISVPKKSKFDQNFNFSKKSEGFSENQKQKYEYTVQIWANSG
jgi:hypothetical protein